MLPYYETIGFFAGLNGDQCRPIGTEEIINSYKSGWEQGVALASQLKKVCVKKNMIPNPESFHFLMREAWVDFYKKEFPQ